jgi:hypothetical protein
MPSDASETGGGATRGRPTEVVLGPAGVDGGVDALAPRAWRSRSQGFGTGGAGRFTGCTVFRIGIGPPEPYGMMIGMVLPVVDAADVFDE